MPADRNVLADELHRLSHDPNVTSVSAWTQTAIFAMRRASAALRHDAGAAMRERLPERAILTLKRMRERAERISRAANVAGNAPDYALWREEIDALDRVLPLSDTKGDAP